MITFECPHCGNPFKVAEAHIGRAGWCRICKGIVVVPDQEQQGRLTDLSLEKQVSYLHNLLRYAATRSDDINRKLAETTRKYEHARTRANAVEELAGAMAATEARLQEAQKGAAELRHELTASSEALGHVMAEKSALTEQVAHLRADLAGAHTSGAELSERLAHLERASQDELNALREQNRTLQEQRDRLESQVDSLTGPGERETRLDAAQRQLELLADELTAERALRAEIETARQEAITRVASLEEDLALTHEEWQEAESRAEAANVVRTELQVALARVEEKDAINRRLMAELGEIAEALRVAEGQADHSRTEAARLQAELDLSELARLELDENLDAVRAQRDTDIGALKTALAEADGHYTELFAEAGAVRERLARAEDQLHAANARIEDLLAQTAQLETERNAASETIDELQAQCRRLREELDQARQPEKFPESYEQGDGRHARAFELVSDASGQDDATTMVIPEIVEDAPDASMLNTLVRFLGPQS